MVERKRGWLRAAFVAVVVAMAATSTVRAADWDATVAAAKGEGSVVVIGPPVKAHRDAIMTFEKAYPGIKVEFTGMAPGQYTARLTSERAADKFLWDILITGVSSTVYSKMIPAGWLDPIRPLVDRADVTDDSKWLGGFASGFLDPDGKYVYAFTADRAANVFVNTDAIDAKAFTFDSLLDAKWKGKIASLDPRSRGPGSTAFRQVLAGLGSDKAAQLLRTQDLVLSETPKQIVDWAVRGTYPVLIGVDTATLNTYQRQGIGKNLAQIDDAKGTLLTKWGNVMLMNRAPHPNAAKVFVNWLLSKGAQADWATSAGVNSRRTDVPVGNDKTVLTADMWKTGYNLSSYTTAKEGVAALKIAAESLK